MDRIAAIKAGARFPPPLCRDFNEGLRPRKLHRSHSLSLSSGRIIPGLREQGKDPRGGIYANFPMFVQSSKAFLGGKNPCGRISKHAKSGADGDTKHRS